MTKKIIKINKTKKKLIENGLPVMNWVCHLPVYYEWNKLFSIYDAYHCDIRSYVVEQLYFNTYYSNSDYIVIEEEPKDYQYKQWDKKHSIEEFMKAMKTKIWVCNSVSGWNPEIENVLSAYYGL